MSEKGYDNIFLLSGGIESFLRDHPNLIEGTKIPVVTKTEKKTKTLKRRSNFSENRKENEVNFGL